MAKQQTTATEALAKVRGRAKPIASMTEEYVGFPLTEIFPDGTDTKAHKMSPEELFDVPITVLGFSPRKGNKGDFAVVYLVPDGLDELHVLVTGGTVILRKLSVAKEQDGFPFTATITKPSGKEYFDLK